MPNGLGEEGQCGEEGGTEHAGTVRVDRTTGKLLERAARVVSYEHVFAYGGSMRFLIRCDEQPAAAAWWDAVSVYRAARPGSSGSCCAGRVVVCGGPRG